MTDKQNALTERPENFENRLFFQARNLAVEALLLRLETLLLREGFPVTCHWNESSRYKPTIEIRFHNESKTASWDFCTAKVYVERDQVQVFNRDMVSSCLYSFDKVVESEYWGGKQPKKLLEFRARIKALGELGYFTEEIRKINYPLDREFLTSF